MKLAVIGFITIILLLAMIVNMKNLPKDLYLIPQEVVPIYASEGAAVGTVAKPTATLSPFQKVQVLECIDVKHYQIYKVLMLDGSQRFVSDGNYILQRYSRPAACW